MRHCVTRLAAAIAVISLAGCGSTPKHTNALLFSTSTKFAFDVSVNPAGGTPDLTIGYKRVEGVWMPLLANQSGDTPATCSDGDCKFIGEETTEQRKDTYSVLASFGATFEGGADTSTSSGASPTAKAKIGGGLAQFFATGIAAQKLAQYGNARLVSVQPADAEAADLARENANASKARADAAEKALRETLGEKAYSDITTKGAGASRVLMAKNGVIVASITDASGNLDSTKWVNLVDASSLDSTLKTQLKGLNNLGQVSAYLAGQAASEKSDAINSLHSKL